jgi:formylglycine-generating enzyme required for sulfatase activity
MSHIFLSYSTKNKDYAYRLADALRDAGFDVWIDNEALRAGDEWWESIVRALRAAAAFVVIMTPDSRSSRWVQREVLLAEQWNKPSFPILLEGENFEIYVSTQYYDLRDASLPKFKFYEQLAHHAKRADIEGEIVTKKPSAQAPKDAAIRDALKDAPPRELPKQSSTTKSLIEQSKAVLANPLDWAYIPAGDVKILAGGYLKEATSFAVRSFNISKYPITNAQFAEFITAGGYENPMWWTELGWKTRLEGWATIAGDWKPTGKAWTEPLYWNDSKFNGEEQPVVGVSWFEALAYCQWLSGILTLPHNHLLNLPTEQQWQRAAQGDDLRLYPWGNQWDFRRCNSSVDGTGIGKTNNVKVYEGRGDSPFGAVDMAGNIAEWCLTGFRTGTQEVRGREIRVLRGGSRYSTLASQLQAAARDEGDPDIRNNLIGFRIAVSPQSLGDTTR